VNAGRISPDHAAELTAFFADGAGDLFGYACVLTRGDPPRPDHPEPGDDPDGASP
jgi:hypothetical protein